MRGGCTHILGGAILLVFLLSSVSIPTYKWDKPFLTFWCFQRSIFIGYQHLFKGEIQDLDVASSLIFENRIKFVDLANHNCDRVPLCLFWHRNVQRSQPCIRKFKRHKCPNNYYPNSTATFHSLLIGDLVFKLNPGPTGSKIPTIVTTRKDVRHSTRLSTAYSNPRNLIRVNCTNLCK